MGLSGCPFTMRAETGPVWAKKNDPRCTALGAFMRQMSLDELPQLFNVLPGEMSLVGPRPLVARQVHQVAATLPGLMLRHNVKAGMTGWAEVNDLCGGTPTKERLEYDLLYINNWPLGFDRLILLLTSFVVLFSKNAS